MDTTGLKAFAQDARRTLREQVTGKLDLVIAPESAARREAPAAVAALEGQIANTSRDQVIEKAAYTWFNRFCALRFMDANGYTGTRVVSPADGQSRPEILAEAMAGVIVDEVPASTASKVRALLEARIPSPDPQGEAYRLLLVAACNHWHGAMPFLFETIADYTELLIPDDLLSPSSLLARMRKVMSETACQDVEIIGWLYQFYVSEKKDEVFAELKKGCKVTPENIPAATQLFTPHWIVRYLVENSLGRLWLLNRPASRLAERMDYYIAPETPEPDFIRIAGPEEIKICDPACGSGHMLTYAFDLLHTIYEEEGYDQGEIPELILTKNLFGLEIDQRAGALAAFALTMKARASQRRFFRQSIKPNICVLENVAFEAAELNDYTRELGTDLFTKDLREALSQFSEADNFGSLIQPALSDVSEVRRVIEAKSFDSNLFLRDVHARVQSALRMADFLNPKYHVVVANPPYMGSGGMNDRLKNWSDRNYKDSKFDLYSMFIERNLHLSLRCGIVSMITMHGWMFLSRLEPCRHNILNEGTILSIAHLGPRGFDSIGGEVVSTAAFVLQASQNSTHKGQFFRLLEGNSEREKVALFFEAKHDPNANWRFDACSEDFRKIPGAPIAYWISERVREIFASSQSLGSIGEPTHGVVTGDNDRFLRRWHEVSLSRTYMHAKDREDAESSGAKWFPVSKGGSFRRWNGNLEFLIDWERDGHVMRTVKHSSGRIRATNFNLNRIFQPGITWSTIANTLSMRYLPGGMIFESKGSVCFSDNEETRLYLLAITNTKVVNALLLILSPTLDYHEGPMSRLPIVDMDRKMAVAIAVRCRWLSGFDWDAGETSWGFTTFPLLSLDYQSETLEATYARMRAHWRNMTEEMRQLEEENNRLFIDAYGLHDELTAEVPVEEITLTCNPAYRYGGEKAEAELEELLLADTIREFVSYAVGCMFGRYSLNDAGPILANQGEGLEDYRAKVPHPTFEPDADNVIPVLDGDWFADDIAARFRRFLRDTFGDEQFEENLSFVEEALGKDIRRYFTRDFFNDHVKRYRKRPIYWLFSSPKGTFNALIYMHRYRPDTVSVMLNDYLREFRSKLEAYKVAHERVSTSLDATGPQQSAAVKEVQVIAKQIDELDAWERDVIFPMASRRIEIDLDDGVKANYAKFEGALKPIKGLSDADD